MTNRPKLSGTFREFEASHSDTTRGASTTNEVVSPFAQLGTLSTDERGCMLPCRSGVTIHGHARP